MAEKTQTKTTKKTTATKSKTKKTTPKKVKTTTKPKEAKKPPRKQTVKAKGKEYTPEEVAQINRLYLLAKWYQNLKKTNNDTFLPLFENQSRYLVLKGGGGSGKSIFAGRKILERVTSEKGHRWLVVRNVQKSLKNSCWKQLQAQLSQHYPNVSYETNKTDLTITIENGSEIIFTGLDDVEKLKSIYNVTGIWIEEASEILESDFNQLDIRLRGNTKHYKQIILSFNPVSALHWLKKRFFDKQDGKTTTHESTYKDNRFLDAEQIAVLEDFKNHDEYYYQVYCLGQWGVTGKTVFNAKAVAERLANLKKPLKQGYFTFDYDGLKISNAKLSEEQDGFIEFYKDAQDGVPYVLAGDTAGDGSDSFVAQVLDNRTGEQVARLKHQFDEDLFTRQVYCLGKYYNTALVAIENNFSTYPTRELQRLGYPKMYVRETIDSYTGKPKQSFGFRTDKNSRNAILANLIGVVRENIELVNDRATLEEMLTFVRNEEHRAEAEKGAHDDCIMSLAIAHFIRPQQSYIASTAGETKTKWTKDMLEDYRRANKAGKEYLIQKWGQPQ